MKKKSFKRFKRGQNELSRVIIFNFESFIGISYSIVVLHLFIKTSANHVTSKNRHLKPTFFIPGKFLNPK